LELLKEPRMTKKMREKAAAADPKAKKPDAKGGKPDPKAAAKEKKPDTAHSEEKKVEYP